jgi:anti-sigma regulatory factor (Ser/Thr protein kinase)
VRVNGVLELRVRATPEAVRGLRRAAVEVFRLLGGAASRYGDVELAVSEAVSNTVRHAYPGRNDGYVELSAWVEDDDLFIIAVRDRGVGAATPSRNPGARLGVALMCHLADAELTQREDGGTETRLAFPLRSAHPTTTTAHDPGTASLQEINDAVNDLERHVHTSTASTVDRYGVIGDRLLRGRSKRPGPFTVRGAR